MSNGELMKSANKMMQLNGCPESLFRRALELNPAILGASSDVTVAGSGNSTLMQYYYFAKICASTGKVDAALEFLKKAQAAGFMDFKKVRHDPDFKAVVADSRFERIAQ